MKSKKNKPIIIQILIIILRRLYNIILLGSIDFTFFSFTFQQINKYMIISKVH